MRAMLLAAGRGERMRPLTDTVPKPLLEVGGKPLIVWHIERLVAAGIRDIAINLAWLGDEIRNRLGCGNRWGARFHYLHEATALETAGGIANALDWLGDAPFLVINGDVWCDWDPGQAHHHAQRLLDRTKLACLLLVDNPEHNAAGDFLFPDLAASPLTFAGIGIYQPQLFAGLKPGEPAPLAPLLHQALGRGQLLAQHHRGRWVDVGTPQRLQQLDRQLTADLERRPLAR